MKLIFQWWVVDNKNMSVGIRYNLLKARLMSAQYMLLT